MTKHATSVAMMAWAVSWFFLTAAKTTTVISPRFEEMTGWADLDFAGKVAGSRAEWRSVGTNRVMFTPVKFETLEVLKWNVDRDLLGITILV